MGRRGHSTAVGKFAKIHHDRQVSDIRILGEQLRLQQRQLRRPNATVTDHDDTLPTQLLDR